MGDGKNKHWKFFCPKNQKLMNSDVHTMSHFIHDVSRMGTYTILFSLCARQKLSSRFMTHHRSFTFVCVVFSLLKDVAQICSKTKFTSNIKYNSVHGGNKSCCIYILAWLTTVTLSIRKKKELRSQLDTQVDDNPKIVSFQ
jgi:hypothetical protein